MDSHFYPPKQHYIYLLINPLNQAPFYIGMTNNMEDRIKQHIDGKDDTTKKLKVIKHIQNENMTPVVVILEKPPTRVQAKKAEKFWIETFMSRGSELINKEGGKDSISFHIQKTTEHNKPAQTISENKREIEKGNRHGAPWDAVEINTLTESFLGATISEIAANHKRSESSIKWQLQKMAARNKKIRQKLRSLGLLLSQSGY